MAEGRVRTAGGVGLRSSAQPTLPHFYIPRLVTLSGRTGFVTSMPVFPFHASRRAQPEPPGRWVAPAKPNTQRILLTSCPFHTAPAWLRSLGFAGSAQRRSSTYPQCREIRAVE